jgi:hypothetical protein
MNAVSPEFPSLSEIGRSAIMPGTFLPSRQKMPPFGAARSGDIGRLAKQEQIP